ncbi:MAG: HEAT repeat domain-containing protein [Planctomycetota bacterium]|jgi:HEAT repeat protein
MRTGFTLCSLFWLGLALHAPLAGGEEVKDPKAWKALIKEIGPAFQGEDEDARAKAVERLGDANYPDAVKFLLDVLAKPDPFLAVLEWESAKLGEKIRTLARKVRDRPPPDPSAPPDPKRQELKRLRDQFKNLNNRIFKASGIRGIAVAGLGKTRNPDAVQWLVEQAAENPSGHARLGIAEALGSIPGEGEVVKALVRLSGDKDPKVRAAALDSLGALKVPEGLEAARKALSEKIWQVRAAAIVALGKSGDLKEVENLIAVLEAEEGRLREDADRVLQALTGKTFGGDAELWKAWWARSKEAGDRSRWQGRKSHSRSGEDRILLRDPNLFEADRFRHRCLEEHGSAGRGTDARSLPGGAGTRGGPTGPHRYGASIEDETRDRPVGTEESRRRPSRGCDVQHPDLQHPGDALLFRHGESHEVEKGRIGSEDR